MSNKICVVTTLRAPKKQVLSFVNYHLNIGIDHLFLFFDNPAGKESRKIKSTIKNLKAYAQVTCFIQNAGRDKSKRLPLEDSQRKNADMILRIARERGFDWISHIDVDELIYTAMPLKRVLEEVPNAIDFIRLPTLEAVPEKLTCENPFKEVSLFRNNFWKFSKKFFKGHIAGKAIVRVKSKVSSLGIHRPIQKYPKLKSRIALLNARLLHFNRCSFEVWEEGWISRMNGDSFAKEGGLKYDVMMNEFKKVYETGNKEKLKELYKKQFFIPSAKKRILSKAGILIRINLNKSLFDKIKTGGNNRNQ